MTTVREIARDAGLSTGALFSSFADKNEIFAEIFIDEAGKILRAIATAHDVRKPLPVRIMQQILAGYRASGGDTRLMSCAIGLLWCRALDAPSDDITRGEIVNFLEVLRDIFFETLRYAQSRQELPTSADIGHGAELLKSLSLSNLPNANRSHRENALTKRQIERQIRIVVDGLRRE